jgi:TonB family protein
MLRIAALVLLLAAALGQEAPAPTRISPDDAAKHLIKSNAPEYPPLAQAARIQGNVILEIGIDETGAASVRRLVSGHPMLAPAAVRDVNGWTYQPFEVDGKPTRVLTFVSVWFGGSANNGAASGQAEALLENAFWSAVDAAQAALAKGDYAGSEEQMMKAKEAVPPEGRDLHHMTEQWQWMTTMGRLRMAQQKYD